MAKPAIKAEDLELKEDVKLDVLADDTKADSEDEKDVKSDEDKVVLEKVVENTLKVEIEKVKVGSFLDEHKNTVTDTVITLKIELADGSVEFHDVSTISKKATTKAVFKRK
jgi:hypothetical protein